MKVLSVLLMFVALVIRIQMAPGLDIKDTYKDMVHIFVGGMFAAAFTLKWVNSYLKKHRNIEILEFDARGGFFLWIALAMTLIEVICGLYGKYTGQALLQLF